MLHTHSVRPYVGPYVRRVPIAPRSTCSFSDLSPNHPNYTSLFISLKDMLFNDGYMFFFTDKRTDILLEVLLPYELSCPYVG